MHPGAFDLLTLELKHYFQYLQEAGCRGFTCSPEALKMLERWGKPEAAGRETLAEIRTDLGTCRRCKLAVSRHNIVFGEGNPQARLMFVGEGPGFEEDRQGRPFVGPAGELLTKIIQAIKLSREEVYIANVVKCRPPENRTPSTDEINICLPYLKRQIRAIGPDIICTLGSTAARALLDTVQPITLLRGRFHAFEGIPLMPTFHPAYLLRNADKKREVWEDMKKIMAALDQSAY